MATELGYSGEERRDEYLSNETVGGGMSSLVYAQEQASEIT